MKALATLSFLLFSNQIFATDATYKCVGSVVNEVGQDDQSVLLKNEVTIKVKMQLEKPMQVLSYRFARKSFWLDPNGNEELIAEVEEAEYMNNPADFSAQEANYQYSVTRQATQDVSDELTFEKGSLKGQLTNSIYEIEQTKYQITCQEITQ